MDYGHARILIADDESINIKVLLAILDEFECLIAKDGEKALTILEGGARPDLILLDVMMPGLDGYEVCKRIKSNPEIDDIPVIFITSKGSVDEEAYGLSLGAADYITKPFSPEIVRARATNQIQFKMQRDMLLRLNVTDSLTGIANRRCFDETLDYECRSSARSGAMLSLIIIDIDHFKQVNDQGGHVFGDQCLKDIAQALCDSVTRSIDLVARYGGDEFVALLPSTNKDGALAVAENMRKNVESLELNHENFCGKVSVSIGVATANKKDELQPARLIEKSDKQLYSVKKSGRNGVSG